MSGAAADMSGAVTTLQEKDKVRGELSHMISDLNEVHMKLDALLGKLSGSLDHEADDVGVENLRRNFDRQLDRIREKLAERLRSIELATT